MLISEENGSAAETTALLGSDGPAHPSPRQRDETAVKPWISVVVLCILGVMVMDIGAYLFQAPQMRLYESIICSRYFDSIDVPEKHCKIDAIQDDLAMVLGWQALFDNLPSILLAIPYCTIADRYGRKWILTLCYAGVALDMAWILFVTGMTCLPIQFTWLSSAWMVLGGGGQVTEALIYTIVADVVPPQHMSTVFFYLTAGVLAAELMASPIASILMQKSLWLPLISGLVGQLMGIAITLAVPETLGENAATAPVGSGSSREESAEDSVDASDSSKKEFRPLTKAKETLEFLFRD